MAYFLAPSLVQLRVEVNRLWPGRDRTSDGWVGDTAHQARKSDHNPDYAAGGIVRALDIDHDGIDKHLLRQKLIADPRIEYVIQDWKIYRRATGFRAEKYTGSNGHTAHTHASIRHTAAGAAGGPWGLYGGAPAPSPAPAPAPSVSFEQVVVGVIAGQYSTGDERKRRVEAAGHNYEAVRAEVNRRLGGGAPAPAPARKTNEQIATEVMRGEWGNNPQRSQRLQAAGYNPSDIQAIINGGGGKAAPVRLSVSQLADQVIKGQWGDGRERERRITAAGYDYQAVRAEVNRRL